MTDTKTDTDTFDPLAALDAAPAKDLPATFADHTLAELKAMRAAEMAKDDKARRKTVLQALDQEIALRATEQLLEQLDTDDIARAAELAYRAALTEDEWDDLTAERRQEAIHGVEDVLISPDCVDRKDPFIRALLVIAPLLGEVKLAQAAIIAPGDDARQQLADAPRVDHGDAEMEKIVAGFTKLAFCSGKSVEFTVDVEPGDFRVNTLQIAYAKEVKLRRDKRAVSIDNVVALDDAGQPSMHMRMPCPLSGGGGREGRFPPYSIAFFK